VLRDGWLAHGNRFDEFTEERHLRPSNKQGNCFRATIRNLAILAS
jgi:hypothetical protein